MSLRITAFGPAFARAAALAHQHADDLPAVLGPGNTTDRVPLWRDRRALNVGFDAGRVHCGVGDNGERQEAQGGWRSSTGVPDRRHLHQPSN